MKIFDKETGIITDVKQYFDLITNSAGKTEFDNYFLGMLEVKRFKDSPNVFVLFPANDNIIYIGRLI